MFDKRILVQIMILKFENFHFVHIYKWNVVWNFLRFVYWFWWL